MADTVISFNGIDSDTLGFTVERAGAVPIPQRKIDVYDIPGANGSLISTQDAFNNVTLTYDIYFHSRKYGIVAEEYEDADIESVQHSASALAKWLFGGKGYQTLTDSNDPLYYREAYAVGGTDVENILRKYGKYRVEFICKPQRFRLMHTVYGNTSSLFGRLGMLPIINFATNGLEVVTSEPNQIIPAKPMIYVPCSTANSDALIRVDGINYQIVDMPIGGIWVDCENKIVTNFTKTQLKNSCWTAMDFPSLAPPLVYPTDPPDDPSTSEDYHHIQILNWGTDNEIGAYIDCRWFTI